MKNVLISAIFIIFLLLVSGCVAPQQSVTCTSIKSTPSLFPVTTLAESPQIIQDPNLIRGQANITNTISSSQKIPDAPSPSGTGLGNDFSGKYIDVHVHFQPSAFSVKDLIKSMDQEGIEIAINMQPPSHIFQNRNPKEYGIPNDFKAYPGRVLFLYGGPAASLLDSVVKRGSYSESEQEQYINFLEDAMKSGYYCGFGEIALRHKAIATKESGQSDVTVPGDHPWMFIMSDIAAKYDVPIDIHMEASPKDVARLEKLLYHNNQTKIIWDHAGWQKTPAGLEYPDYVTPELWRKLFDQHPNLYTSIKIRPDSPGMDPSHINIFDSDNRIRADWMQLFRDYPDRFLIGSDIKPGQGIPSDGFEFILDHRNLLKQLSSEIERKFERENAIKIFKIAI